MRAKNQLVGQGSQVTPLPQPSGPLYPQFLAGFSGVQQEPETQYWLLWQPPQSTCCPQPLLMDPQAVPGPELHSGGAQHCPPSQSSLPGQLPQFRGVPQPSPLKPHSTPRSSQLSGEQQLLKRQTSSSGQDPQGIVPPQPSGASPHSPSPHAATSRGIQYRAYFR